MSSFRDALAGLKTSSSSSPGAHLLPTSAGGSGSGSQTLFSSLRDGASSIAASTGSAFSSLARSTDANDSGPPVTTRGEWFGLTLMQRWIGFGGCAVLAVFCFLMAFMSLPLMIVSPQKFATAFSLGSLSSVSGIALLRGPRAHTRHLFSRERLLFTGTYFGSVFFTLFFSAIAHSYIGTLFFVIVQVIALVWYVVSYFPGGSAGLQSTTASLASSARTLLPF